ncbi:MAG: glucose-6-phosphate dehydrogenase assembly protein OpcA [Aeriscardovia sp.]|nr:glucose-6-phosphate dehydrogenase assembly protein OpcA [Aeriscardovia sp.]
MEEALEGREGGWEPLFEALAPKPLNRSAALLALGGREREAEKAASAFSCAAFSVERGGEEDGAWQKARALPGGGVLVSLRLGRKVPLDHALFQILPEGAALTVFDPGRVEIKEGLYSMCSCYVTDAGDREVLRNFEALSKAGGKAIDLSWERTRQWRERALSLFSGKAVRSFSIEAGRLDAGVLLLAGWIKGEFSLPAKIAQGPAFDASVSKISALFEGGEADLREGEGGKAFEIRDGGESFSAPKEEALAGDLLVRQMGLLPPDPLYRSSLSFEIEGAQDVG